MVLLRSRRSTAGNTVVVEPVNLQVRVPPNRHDNDKVEVVARPRGAFERARKLDAMVEKKSGGPMRSVGKRDARQQGRSPYATKPTGSKAVAPADDKGSKAPAAIADNSRSGPVPLRAMPSISTQMTQLDLSTTAPISSRTRSRGASASFQSGPSEMSEQASQLGGTSRMPSKIVKVPRPSVVRNGKEVPMHSSLSTAATTTTHPALLREPRFTRPPGSTAPGSKLAAKRGLPIRGACERGQQSDARAHGSIRPQLVPVARRSAAARLVG